MRSEKFVYLPPKLTWGEGGENFEADFLFFYPHAILRKKIETINLKK